MRGPARFRSTAVISHSAHSSSSPRPKRFRFTLRNRIPLERGLGSSAATIALGLVAGAAAAGRETDAQSLLAAGAPLEGHVDNLAAALCGGACIAWNRNGAPHATRVATVLPFVPVVVIPETRTNTAASRVRASCERQPRRRGRDRRRSGDARRGAGVRGRGAAARGVPRPAPRALSPRGRAASRRPAREPARRALPA